MLAFIADVVSSDVGVAAVSYVALVVLVFVVVK